MHTWMWLVLLGLGLIKLPVAALMLWLPFRSDAALESHPPTESPADSSDEDDGGSKTLAGEPRDPHPRLHPRVPRHGRGPHRGPHGGGAPASPARVRTARRAATRVRARQ
jgi:hypothetical protein